MTRGGSPAAPVREAIDAGDVQVLAHTLIADLFAAGLRVQTVAAQAPAELQPQLDEIADQLDKVIRELRTFAFEHAP